MKRFLKWVKFHWAMNMSDDQRMNLAFYLLMSTAYIRRNDEINVKMVFPGTFANENDKITVAKVGENSWVATTVPAEPQTKKINVPQMQNCGACGGVAPSEINKLESMAPPLYEGNVELIMTAAGIKVCVCEPDDAHKKGDF